MSKFSKRLRYSVGGTYRWYGPGKSLSVDKGSSRFFFIFTERLTKEGYRMMHPSYFFVVTRFTPISFSSKTHLPL